MWGWSKSYGGLLLLGCITCVQIRAQVFTWNDYTFPSGKSPVFGTFPNLPVKESLEYSLTCSNFYYLNWARDKSTNNFMLLQSLKYLWQFEGKKNCKISNQWVHNLGAQFFFDSITRIHIDDNTITTRFEIPVIHNVFFTITSIINTRLLNGYDYRENDSGNLVRVLNSSFLTPLTWNISNGFSWKSPLLGSLTLGLSGAKITYVRDKSIYDRQKTTLFYGVPVGKGYLFEYGFSLQFIADKDLLKWMHWNCDFFLFKKHDAAPWDVNMKNQFGLKISRWFRLNIQTRLFYEEEVSMKLQFENLVSLGFFFNL